MRTDMALERLTLSGEGAPKGVRVSEQRGENWTLTRIEVRSEEGARALQKPKGVYITLETPAFPDEGSLASDLPRLLAGEIGALLPANGAVLVVGLGNPGVTPDALGPKTADGVFATAHLTGEALRLFPPLRRVWVLKPGVTGQTGTESALIVEAVGKALRPDCVIAVDALAAGSVTRLGSHVQIASSGIEPGAGVGNARRELSFATLGVPVIGVGVPTVVDARTLAGELSGADPAEKTPYDALMVTPRDVDAMILSASRFLSLSLNLALQKNLTAEFLLGIR